MNILQKFKDKRKYDISVQDPHFLVVKKIFVYFYFLTTGQYAL